MLGLREGGKLLEKDRALGLEVEEPHAYRSPAAQVRGRELLGSGVEVGVLPGVEGGVDAAPGMLVYHLVVFLDHHQRPRAVEKAVKHEPDFLAGGVHLLEEQQPSSAHRRGHQPVLEGHVPLPGRQESADDVVGGGEAVQVHAVDRGSEIAAKYRTSSVLPTPVCP